MAFPRGRGSERAKASDVCDEFVVARGSRIWDIGFSGSAFGLWVLGPRSRNLLPCKGALRHDSCLSVVRGAGLGFKYILRGEVVVLGALVALKLEGSAGAQLQALSMDSKAKSQ